MTSLSHIFSLMFCNLIFEKTCCLFLQLTTCSLFCFANGGRGEGDSRSVWPLWSLWISATKMWINNQRPSVTHTFVLTHTHTHTPAFPNSPPPNCTSSWALRNVLKCRRSKKRICLESPWFGEKVTVGFSRVEYPFHFIFFKCHEDWVVRIWQCTRVHNICHPPSLSAWRPLCLLELCHLYVRAAPRQCAAQSSPTPAGI